MKLRICLMYMISATVLMLVVGLAGDREIRLRAGSGASHSSAAASTVLLAVSSNGTES